MKKMLMIFLLAISSTAYGQPWDCKKDFFDKGDSWGYEKCVMSQKIDAQNRARQEAQEAAIRAQQESEKRRLDAEARLRQEAERIRTRNMKPQLNTVD